MKGFLMLDLVSDFLQAIFLLAPTVISLLLLALWMRESKKRKTTERRLEDIAEFLQWAGEETLPDGTYSIEDCLGYVPRFSAAIYGVVNQGTRERMVFVCRGYLPPKSFHCHDGTMQWSEDSELLAGTELKK